MKQRTRIKPSFIWVSWKIFSNSLEKKNRVKSYLMIHFIVATSSFFFFSFLCRLHPTFSRQHTNFCDWYISVEQKIHNYLATILVFQNHPFSQHRTAAAATTAVAISRIGRIFNCQPTFNIPSIHSFRHHDDILNQWK